MGVESPIPDSVKEKKEKEDFSDLCIYTTTFYGKDKTSQIREKLAEKLLENVAKLGIKCVVVDGGSNQNFLDKASSRQNVNLVVNPNLGMGESRRESLRMAIKSGVAYYLWVEPEKYDLIRSESLKIMLDGLRKDKTDIVVPRRVNKESMPKLQAWIETRANKRAKELLSGELKAGEELDLWFGPKMFNRAGAEFFLNYKGKLDKWDGVVKPVVEAHKNGKRVSSVGVDYKYDSTQSLSEAEDRVIKEKRLEQYATILAEMGDSFWKNKNKI